MSSSQEKAGIAQALTAACLFGISIPIAKHLLGDVGPQWLAGFLYLGSGGALAHRLVRSLTALVDLGRRAPARRLHLFLDRAELLGTRLLAVTTGFFQPLVPGDRPGHLDQKADGLVSDADTDILHGCHFKHGKSSFRAWIGVFLPTLFLAHPGPLVNSSKRVTAVRVLPLRDVVAAGISTSVLESNSHARATDRVRPQIGRAHV